jgi:hypothetical protein
MAAWVRETLSQRAWSTSKSDRPPSPRISVVAVCRLRAEARLVCHTWAQQTGLPREHFEVVFAEFGESPSVFPDEASRQWFDSYLFAYMPNTAPHAMSWWRNVGVWRARGQYTLLIDADNALSPAACTTILNALKACGCARPAALHPPLQLSGASQVEPGQPYDLIIRGAGTRETYESIWAFDTEGFKAMGGWCEAFTGYAGEETFFNHRAYEAFCIAGAPRELFCHIPHARHAAAPEIRSIYDRLPLLPGAPTCDLLEWKKNHGEPYWPLKGWPLGDPGLLQREAVSIEFPHGRTSQCQP